MWDHMGRARRSATALTPPFLPPPLPPLARHPFILTPPPPPPPPPSPPCAPRRSQAGLNPCFPLPLAPLAPSVPCFFSTSCFYVVLPPSFGVIADVAALVVVSLGALHVLDSCNKKGIFQRYGPFSRFYFVILSLSISPFLFLSLSPLCPPPLSLLSAPPPLSLCASFTLSYSLSSVFYYPCFLSLVLVGMF